MRSLLLCLLLLLVHKISAQEWAFYPSESRSQEQPSFIYDIAKDDKGALYLATGQGVMRKSLNNDSLLQHPNSSGYSNFASSIYINQNELWVGYYDGSICEIINGELQAPLQGVNGKIQDLVSLGDSLYFISNQSLYRRSKMAGDSAFKLSKSYAFKQLHLINGELIASTSEGLRSITKSAWIHNEEMLVVREHRQQLYGLSQNAIWQLGQTPKRLRSIELDPSWIIEDFVVIEEANTVVLGGNFGLAKVLLGNNDAPQLLLGVLNSMGAAVRSLYLDENTLWIGTYGEFLWFSRPTAGPVWYESFQNFQSNGMLWAARKDSKIVIGLEKNYQLEILEEFESNAEFCIIDNKVFVLEQGVLRAIYPSASSKLVLESFPNGIVTKLGYLGDQIFYVCLQHKGIAFYDLSSGEKTAAFSTENGLLHNDVTQVIQGNGEDIWLLSRKNGVTLLQGNEIARYFTLNDGLPSLDITAMTLVNNELWLSTEGGGLAVIDREYRCHQVRLQKESEPEYFYGIGNYNQDLLAFARDYLLQLKQQDKARFPFPKFQKSVVPSEGPITQLAKGISIPCYNGVLYLPAKTFTEEASIKVSVASIESDLQGRINDAEVLNYGNHELRIQFELNGSNPLAKNESLYKLEGYHKNWQSLHSGEVLLSSVRSGNYSIKILQQGKEYNLFSFKVDVPFWRKPIFMALVALFLLLGYIGLLRWRTYRLKERNRELEAVVTARTRDLAKRNEELQQFTYAISHDLKNPAANIGELIDAIKEDFPELDEDISFYLKQLDKASGKLYNNLLDLLEVLKHANEGELPREQISLPSVIEDIKDKISGIIAKNGAEILCDFEAFDSLLYNKVNLHSILYNLVSNGIKYRKADVNPVVKIKTLVQDGFLAIRISDNGLGMDLNKNKDELFGLFKRFHDHVEGTGVGLYLVNAMVEKEGGRIEVDSELGRGTEFTLYLVPEGQ